MNKVAFISGCAKGIGKITAKILAKSGYDLILHYNTSYEGIMTLKEELESVCNVTVLKADLKEEIEIKNMVDIIKQKYDHIDLLVNTAALDMPDDIIDKTYEQFLDVIKVNLVAPFFLIKSLMDLLKGGVIINIASTDGINTYNPISLDYCASKAGLINLTKNLALRLDDIRVYAICPNWVDTESIREMNPDYLNDELQRIGQRELIDPISVAYKVKKLAISNMKSGSIVVMEDKYE